MLSTRLLIIMLTFLLAASSIAAAADTPSFPDMTCKGSGSGTCTPGNAPFFNIGPIDETKYDPDPASKRIRQRGIHRHQQVANSSEAKALVGRFRQRVTASSAVIGPICTAQLVHRAMLLEPSSIHIGL